MSNLVSLTRMRIQLALRNKTLPLEGLRYDVTPTGMHYTLIHYDIPSVDVTAWHLDVNGHVQKRLSLTLESSRSAVLRCRTCVRS